MVWSWCHIVFFDLSFGRLTYWLTYYPRSFSSRHNVPFETNNTVNVRCCHSWRLKDTTQEIEVFAKEWDQKDCAGPMYNSSSSWLQSRGSLKTVASTVWNLDINTFYSISNKYLHIHLLHLAFLKWKLTCVERYLHTSKQQSIKSPSSIHTVNRLG